MAIVKRRPKVFVVNEPLQRDHSGEMTRKIDLTPAEEYGELVFLTPAGNPPRDPEPTIKMIQERLKGAQEGDFLLTVGHPLLICWAAAIAARELEGVLTVLIWRAQSQSYQPIKAELWTERDIAA